ncbi:hypothetical protein G9A89_007218 [Geosiphon pyriformis]|nr:hypothetical protein G9A89_007218 [Geosiphon pyriformis]
MKQDTTQVTSFELVYGRTATLPIKIESQEKQKEQHNNQLPNKPVEFKIEDKVLLHRTKVEKQWSEKFDPKWNKPFHIEEILGNGAYKLRWNNKILTKAVHTSSSTNNISQLGVQQILVQPDEIPQDLEPIIIIGPNTICDKGNQEKMEIPDHIYTIAQQLFQALKHFWENTYYGTNRKTYKRELEAIDRTTSKIILLLPVRLKGRMNNVQVEDMKNKIEQTILEKKSNDRNYGTLLSNMEQYGAMLENESTSLSNMNIAQKIIAHHLGI